MKKNQKQNSSEEELRFENEFRKLKISLESGARFYSGSSDEHEELPLEIEKQFLDNIEAFEEALQNSQEINVYEFLDRPEYRKESELSDDELKQELEKLEELMLQKGMTCDVVYSVDDRVFYKFITEELFLKTTANIKVPGFMTHFIYEEFCPNLEEDVKAMCNELLRRFYDNDFNDNYKDMFMNCDNDYQELVTFRKTFTRLIDAEYDEISINLSGHMATYLLEMSFGGIVSEGATPIHYKGEAQFKLECSVDGQFWNFTQINIPGMRVANE